MTTRPWTFARPGRFLRSLECDASLACGSIAAEAADCQVALSPVAGAWGQYLDRPRSHQVGVYGTAAGVGILATSQEHRGVRAKAVTYLLDRYRSRQTDQREAYRFLLVPKLCGVLGAFIPSDLTHDDISTMCGQALNDLDHAQAADGGWGVLSGQHQKRYRTDGACPNGGSTTST